MKALHSIRALVIALTLCASGLVASWIAQAGQPLPLPSVNGPSLGDPTTNLYSVLQGATNNQLSQFNSFLTLTSTASTQAGCTSVQYGMNFLTVTLSGTGAVCLPQAKAGTEIFIANNTSQTVNIFTVTPTTQALGAGQTDYINGTAGTSAYTGLTNGKNTQCFVPQNGMWWCNSGS